jgi:hypothetical protein
MVLLYGRAGCLTAKNGGFGPGQVAVSKTQAAYYRACLELVHAEAHLQRSYQLQSSSQGHSIKKRDDAREKKAGAYRAQSHCRFVLPLIRFIPDLLTYLVPLFLKRQCDRTLGAYDAYDGAIGVLNRAERRVQAEVGDVLDYLEKLEAERLEVTKEAMLNYVNVSSIPSVKYA